MMSVDLGDYDFTLDASNARMRLKGSDVLQTYLSIFLMLSTFTPNKLIQTYIKVFSDMSFICKLAICAALMIGKLSLKTRSKFLNSDICIDSCKKSVFNIL